MLVTFTHTCTHTKEYSTDYIRIFVMFPFSCVCWYINFILFVLLCFECSFVRVILLRLLFNNEPTYFVGNKLSTKHITTKWGTKNIHQTTVPPQRQTFLWHIELNKDIQLTWAKNSCILWTTNSVPTLYLFLYILFWNGRYYSKQIFSVLENIYQKLTIKTLARKKLIKFHFQ